MNGNHHRAHRLAFGGQSRRGQVLLEFAVISVLMMVLFGGMMSLGLILFKANVTQQAADVGAHELARMPLNPVNTINMGNESSYLDDVLYNGDPNANQAVLAVRQQIFDERFLYVSIGAMANASLYDYSAAQQWPLINRLLVPSMIRDDQTDLPGAPVYRYPGAVVTNQDGQPTVLVPIVTARDGNGVETIEWHRAVEEIKYPDENGDSVGQFSLASGASTGLTGIVALRIYCPVQTSIVGYRPNPNNIAGQPPLANLAYVTAADDAAVTQSDPNNLLEQYSLVVPAGAGLGKSDSGEFGMGSFVSTTIPLVAAVQQAGLVRPFRKVVVGQGVYRREVFGP